MAQETGEQRVDVVGRDVAEALIQGLVRIPSLSHQEGRAAAWLVGRMRHLGYARAYVDEVGNAVGEMGPVDARWVVVLLGHIDTVPGNIPVRVEETPDGRVLYGRGSVDAKGPLAVFAAAVARLGEQWAVDRNLRVVVVGAVEEEAATSAGARHIRDRFDGQSELIPTACIIGEPSSWRRVTLGYKGRLLIDLRAGQPMAHTAGPDPGVATVAVDFWNHLNTLADTYNADRPKAFDQLLPSLRSLNTMTDESMWDRVEAKVGLRLPVGYDERALIENLVRWIAAAVEVDADDLLKRIPDSVRALDLEAVASTRAVTLRFSSFEAAWRSDRNNFLVRSFLAAIRQLAPDTRPGFVVKTGTSDMNVVGPAWRCPILAYGPGDSRLDHTPHEHLPLDEYWRAILVLEKALRELAERLPSPANQ